MKSKYLLIAVLLPAFSHAQSQHVFYIKANDQKTAAKDSAYLIRTISDPEPGGKLYDFTEKFATGEPFRGGKTLNSEHIVPEGECTIFYPNGKKMLYTVYDNLNPKMETYYYPDGSVYLTKEYVYHVADPAKPQILTREVLITTCNDEHGKALVINGNGNYISYTPVIDAKYKKYTGAPTVFNPNFGGDDEEHGAIKNGAKDGEWTGKGLVSKCNYTEYFQNGKFVKGISVDDSGKKHNYTTAESQAIFQGGMPAFYSYLSSTIRYPGKSRENNITGKVFATFVIEKDGSLTGIKILKSPGDELSAETLRVLSISPAWEPGTLHGIPVRQQYTVPIAFALK